MKVKTRLKETVKYIQKKEVENVSKTGYLIFDETVQTALSFNAKI